MPASTVNPDSLCFATPTPGPQRLVDSTGAAISLDVTTNADAVDDLDPNDVFVAQDQPGPARLVLRDGSTPDLNAAVLTPYSLVTPPGVVVVG